MKSSETIPVDAPAPVMELAADLSPAVKSIETAYRAIQRQFPGTPDVTIVVKRDQFAWGHTTVAKAWAPSKHDEHTDASHFEIMISGENLRRGARYVAGTLLHESAHAFNLASGKLDTDTNGRHNKLFGTEAERRGLTVAKGDAAWKGYAVTELPEDGMSPWHSRLVATIERGLAKSAAPAKPNLSHLGITPQPEPEGGSSVTITGGGAVRPVTPRKRGNRNLLVASCGCGHKIRLSQGVLETAKPVCQVCTEEFTEA